MFTKITDHAQVAQLHEGDIVRRFPANANSPRESVFDEKRISEVDTYKVKSINLKNGMILLVASRGVAKTFLSPGNSGKLLIKTQDLVSENAWWI